MSTWIEHENGTMECHNERGKFIRISKMMQYASNYEDFTNMVWDITYIFDHWIYRHMINIEDVDHNGVKGYAEWMHEQCGNVIPQAMRDAGLE